MSTPSAPGEAQQIAVRDNPRSARYEAVQDGQVIGILTYERRRRRIDLVHTVTDPDRRGRGAASRMVRTALAEARAAGLKIRVICPFIESWLQRHPDQAVGVESE